MIPEAVHPHFWGFSEGVTPNSPPLAGPHRSLLRGGMAVALPSEAEEIR
jgi:hypothetical protein